MRKRKSKFVCINDDLSSKSQEMEAVIHDFYESFFPLPSQFERDRSGGRVIDWLLASLLYRRLWKRWKEAVQSNYYYKRSGVALVVFAVGFCCWIVIEYGPMLKWTVVTWESRRDARRECRCNMFIYLFGAFSHFLCLLQMVSIQLDRSIVEHIGGWIPGWSGSTRRRGQSWERAAVSWWRHADRSFIWWEWRGWHRERGREKCEDSSFILNCSWKNRFRTMFLELSRICRRIPNTLLIWK